MALGGTVAGHSHSGVVYGLPQECDMRNDVPKAQLRATDGWLNR